MENVLSILTKSIQVYAHEEGSETNELTHDEHMGEHMDEMMGSKTSSMMGGFGTPWNMGSMSGFGGFAGIAWIINSVLVSVLLLVLIRYFWRK